MPRRVLDYPSALGGWHAVVSAGHLLSVAGMTAFFIMIFDSLRQARAATRNTFGISRFNTRLNFYIYELARTKFIQRKGWCTSRFTNLNILKLNDSRFSNYEYLETTLFSYTFKRT
jgi:heme/copper-type cytochrome/quinol oxidase subunit 1